MMTWQFLYSNVTTRGFVKFDDLEVSNLNDLIVSYFANWGVYNFDNLAVYESLKTWESIKFDDLGVLKVFLGSLKDLVTLEFVKLDFEVW